MYCQAVRLLVSVVIVAAAKEDVRVKKGLIIRSLGSMKRIKQTQDFYPEGVKPKVTGTWIQCMCKHSLFSILHINTWQI